MGDTSESLADRIGDHLRMSGPGPGSHCGESWGGQRKILKALRANPDRFVMDSNNVDAEIVTPGLSTLRPGFCWAFLVLVVFVFAISARYSVANLLAPPNRLHGTDAKAVLAGAGRCPPSMRPTDLLVTTTPVSVVSASLCDPTSGAHAQRNSSICSALQTSSILACVAGNRCLAEPRPDDSTKCFVFALILCCRSMKGSTDVRTHPPPNCDEVFDDDAMKGGVRTDLSPQ